jgi:hypothetical protein
MPILSPLIVTLLLLRQILADWLASFINGGEAKL